MNGLPPVALIAASVLLPLLYPLLAARPGWRGALRAALPLLPLPALVLAMLSATPWTLELPWLMLGSTWMLDELRRSFLLLTALLWSTAGLYAVGYLGSEHLRRFCVFWGLTLAGNLGLVLAGDMVSFYTFFSVMTFAAYGLVVHDGSDRARFAGRVYLVMALLGEMALLAGFLLAAQAVDTLLLADLAAGIGASDDGHLITALLIAGFGVKAGLPLLHFWLPLAHPVAPTPASAVLSGAMIKAGLLGWLLALPIGEAGWGPWGQFLIVMGFVGSLGAALFGMLQRDPKTVLAWSSISQMGLIVVPVGAALAAPGHAPVLLPAIALFALHHGLAKGCLFLAVGLVLPASRILRVLLWLLVALPALSLLGLPFTSGALAKGVMKKALLATPDLPLAEHMPLLLQAATLATLVLVVRYGWMLWLKLEPGGAAACRWWGWILATLCSAVLFWWLPVVR
ncbi:complex I subunit 5 family protein [Haliea sp. E1-2-M8]|uniref:complex I subunit 5 family protein n=1 Tax=Haliea sp. E1-2-M8 TaxID=3064706 RepID=UPI002721C79C|nr:complex I subunit 5 family protein [Haliea sp. E1-2-M8]MDO8863094.1 complex I subunit 5 family protein [Haliea sp. E1-2-M8]